MGDMACPHWKNFPCKIIDFSYLWISMVCCWRVTTRTSILSWTKLGGLVVSVDEQPGDGTLSP